MRKYIGIFNYISKRTGLETTKMITYNEDINVVISELILNMKKYSKSITDYHIGIYENDENGIPVRVDKVFLYEIV